MDEEEIKMKMNDRVDISLASGGIALQVLLPDLWEAQLCLWDPEWHSS